MFETLIMADSISNYATVTGFIVGLGVLLFPVVKKTREEKLDTIPMESPFLNSDLSKYVY
jgi:hypothetical protein